MFMNLCLAYSQTGKAREPLLYLLFNWPSAQNNTSIQGLYFRLFFYNHGPLEVLQVESRHALF